MNAVDSLGRTPLHHTVSSGVAEVLLQFGCNYDVRDSTGLLASDGADKSFIAALITARMLLLLVMMLHDFMLFRKSASLRRRSCHCGPFATTITVIFR